MESFDATEPHQLESLRKLDALGGSSSSLAALAGAPADAAFVTMNGQALSQLQMANSSQSKAGRMAALWAAMPAMGSRRVRTKSPPPYEPAEKEVNYLDDL